MPTTPVELRLVPMPADRCGRPIFVDEDLAEGFRRAIEKCSQLTPAVVRQTTETARASTRRGDHSRSGSRSSPPVGSPEILEVEELEREPLRFARERLLFVLGQKARMISEPLRQAERRSKQIGQRGGPNAMEAWSVHQPIDRRPQWQSKTRLTGTAQKIIFPSPPEAYAAFGSDRLS